MSSGDAWSNLSDSWVLNKSWEVVIWVVIVEVGVGYPSVWVGNWSSYGSVDKDWVVVGWVVVEVVAIGNL